MADTETKFVSVKMTESGREALRRLTTPDRAVDLMMMMLKPMAPDDPALKRIGGDLMKVAADIVLSNMDQDEVPTQ
jgi:hypothetical protein